MRSALRETWTGIQCFGLLFGFYFVFFGFCALAGGAFTAEGFGDPSFVERYHKHPGKKPGESPLRHKHVGGWNSHKHGWPDCKKQVTVMSHTRGSLHSDKCGSMGVRCDDITILMDADGNSYKELYHLGNLGDVITIKRPC